MIPAGCAERCPGCSHRELSREESEKRKAEWVRAELGAWSDAMAQLQGPGIRWGYRRKALLHARFVEDRWQFGLLRKRGREEEFIPIPECPLQAGRVNALFSAAAALAEDDLPLVYGLVSGSSLTLILKCRRQEVLVEKLKTWREHWPGDALLVNWNPVAGRRSLDSRHTELVFGEFWGTDQGFRHGPSAFRQQIPEMENLALAQAREFLRASGLQLIVDLYCGLGVSLREWTKMGWKTAGVELSGESLEAAALNAPEAMLFRGRAEDRLPQLEEFTEGREFLAYVNPPRTGLEESVGGWLLAKMPARIAYLSCNPRSLRRDLELLSAAYCVDRIQPLDFFPQTSHVEVLALLSAGSRPRS